MAEKYFVFYRKTGIASAPWPHVQVVRDDDADFSTADHYLSEGWTQGTTHDHAVFDTWEEGDNETDTNVWWITPGSPPTASPVPYATQSLEQRRFIVTGAVQALIDAFAWTQAADAKITPDARRAARTYLADLRAALVSIAASSSPEGVTLPAAPSLAAATKDLIERAGDHMEDNSLGVRLINIPDKLNLLPEWSFDDPDPTLFYGVACTIEFVASPTKTGGYAMKVTKTGLDMQPCAVVSKSGNLCSIRGGDKHLIEGDFRVASGAAIAAAIVLSFEGYDAAKTIPSGDPLSSYGPWLDVPAAYAAEPFRRTIVTAANARWGGLGMRFNLPMATGTSILIDGVSFRKVLASPSIDVPCALTLPPFFGNDIAANGNTTLGQAFFNTTTALSRAFTELKMQRACRVIGAIIVSDAACTAGSLTVRLRKNSVTLSTGAMAAFNGALVLDPTPNPLSSSVFLPYADGVPYAAGDTIGVNVLTDAAWAPTTANISVSLIVALDPF